MVYRGLIDKGHAAVLMPEILLLKTPIVNGQQHDLIEKQSLGVTAVLYTQRIDITDFRIVIG